MKTNVWGLFCLFLSLSISAMPGRVTAEDVIKIGIIGPWEATAGEGIRLAAEMAAEEINHQGGILGKPVKLILENTKYKPAIGTYAYAKLASQDKVIAVIGTASSNVAIPIMEQMARYKVPFLPSGASSNEITDQVKQNYDKYKYLFRVAHSSEEIADFTNDWIINEFIKSRNMKQIALMIESAIWTRPIAQIWEKHFRDAGVEIPVFEYFYKETKDFTPIYSKIINSKAEAICVLSAHVNPANYISQWADMKGPIMVGVIASYSEVWKSSGGKAFSVMTIVFPGVLGITDDEKEFHKKYVNKYHKIPEYTSAYTYDALYILKAAVEKANTTDADALVDALEKTDYKSAAGRWIFDKTSHHSKFGPGYRQIMMAQWQHDGVICVLSPKELKTCDMIYPPWY